MRRVGLIILSGLAIFAIALVGQALAGDASQGKQVTVAHGRFAHRTWSLGVQGRRDKRCYALTLESSHGTDGVAGCDPDRRPPLWSRVMGVSDLNDTATVELNVTRNRVRSMRLRIGHPKSNRPPEWIHVNNQRMSRREARKAGVKRNFRFAVLHSRGSLCVKQVVLFNRKGDRIDKQRVPCEF